MSKNSSSRVLKTHVDNVIIEEEENELKDDQSEMNKEQLDRDIADFLKESKLDLKR